MARCLRIGLTDRPQGHLGQRVERDDPDDGPLRRSSRREMQQVHRGLVEGGGYGYGVQVRFDERLGTVVDHSGGLPGYGSNMRWLPGRRVGVIALANSTYAPMGALTLRMLEVLDANGLVPAAVIPLTPEVQRAAEALVALLADWDHAVADRLFADNVALDQPYADRAAAAADLGSLQIERVAAESATSATIHAGGRRIEFRLAPIGGIEDYEVVQ